VQTRPLMRDSPVVLTLQHLRDQTQTVLDPTKAQWGLHLWRLQSVGTDSQWQASKRS